MADDDIDLGVKLHGAEEAAAALRNLGAVGSEAFANIFRAAASGDLSGLAGIVGGPLANAFVSATQSMMRFVEGQAQTAEALANLGQAIGATLTQMEGLQDAFAAGGINALGFQRSMGMLAQSIAQAWSQIQHSVRTSADEQLGAQLGIQEAALNTQRAYESLDETMTRVSQTAIHNNQSITDANLSLQKAVLSQEKGSGIDTSGQDQILQQEEQINAVVKARQALEDANIKAAQDEAKAAAQIEGAQLAVQKAQLAESQATEKAYEINLRDVGKISQALQDVISNQQKWNEKTQEGIKLSDVSAQTLKQAVVAAAGAQNGGGEPTGLQVLQTMADLFPKMGSSASALNAQLQLVRETMGGAFRPGVASASQIIAVLKSGREALAEFRDEANKFSQTGIGLGPDQVASLQAFSDAWARMVNPIEQVEEHIAAIIGAGLTPFLIEIKNSLESNDGLLNQFAKSFETALKSLSDFVPVISAAVNWVMQMEKAFSELSNIHASTIFLGLELVAGAAAIAIGAIAKAIALVIEGLGMLKGDAALKSFGASASESADKIAASGRSAASSAISTAYTGAGGPTPGFAEGGMADPLLAPSTGMMEPLLGDNPELEEKRKAMAINNESLLAGGNPLLASSEDTRRKVGEAVDSLWDTAKGFKKASGGQINGPGTETSDSIPALLSQGEFVVKAAAVRAYGANMFHALNNMTADKVPGFAMGGHVGGVSLPAPVSGGASSTLNLTIGNEHFNGLKAPAHVATQLKRYAVSQQTTRAGVRPSWDR